MDDWILQSFNIPSVTAELGRENQYLEQWQVKSSDTAFEIMTENTGWWEHTINKLG